MEAANQDVVAVLVEAGLDRAARRVGRCGADALVTGCGRGHYKRVPVRCGHRMCTTCAPKRAGKLAATYRPGVRAFAYPCLLTLTIKNLVALERDDLLKMKRAFARLRRRAVFVGHECTRRCRGCSLAKWHSRDREGWHECRNCKCSGARPRSVTGGLCALEVTASEQTGWHPHLHVVADIPVFANIFRIGAEWRDACAQEGLVVGDYGADIEAIETWARKQKRKGRGSKAAVACSRDAAVDYALKYATKSDVPETMRAQYAAATARVRLVQPFGELIFCAVRRPPKELKDDDPALVAKMSAWMERRRLCECPACKVREARKQPRKMLPMCSCCVADWYSDHRPTMTDEQAGALGARVLALDGADYDTAQKALVELSQAGAPVCLWESFGLYSSLLKWVYQRAHEVPDELLNYVDAWLRAEQEAKDAKTVH